MSYDLRDASLVYKKYLGEPSVSWDALFLRHELRISHTGHIVFGIKQQTLSVVSVRLKVYELETDLPKTPLSFKNDPF